MSDLRLQPALSMPAGFRFDQVPSLAEPAAATPAPSLGPLAAFTGTFHGKGFNTIFRPDIGTPTKLPVPASDDNLLELNLTEETLSFSPSLGAVPNRGEVQGDISLNGVPYLQVINDVTIAGQTTGIHVEPGLWMAVPATSDPAEGTTFMRMASIPHGTTVLAQGKAVTAAGKPAFPVVGITPFGIGSDPSSGSPFASQTAAAVGTVRIPQDLTPFITAGTITQTMLDNPVSLLSSHLAGLNVTSSTAITVSTRPTPPLFGGGNNNMAFLMGDAQATAPNAQAATMEATFWIETVEYTIQVPVFQPGHPPLTIAPAVGPGGAPVPEFLVSPPVAITAPRAIKATATQIQYAQKVFLNFNGLTWPHVSVATLVPAAPVEVPASAFA
ncbi:MAG TPA: heme-binding protein [Trebonia sp.]